MAKFDHPNIIRYYSSWIDTSNIELERVFDSELGSGSKYSENVSNSNSSLIPIDNQYYLFIQMELCKYSLTDYLLNKPFHYIERNRFFKEIVQGINYLHNQYIIHRDLKPSNILFSESEQIKITDFGMSIFQSEPASNIKGSDLFGTYTYNAPETLKDNNYSIYSDIYSLGIIMFELLNNFKTIMEKNVAINELKAKKDFSESLCNYKKECDFILKLLDDTPDERIDTNDILKIKLLFSINER